MRYKLIYYYIIIFKFIYYYNINIITQAISGTWADPVFRLLAVAQTQTAYQVTSAKSSLSSDSVTVRGRPFTNSLFFSRPVFSRSYSTYILIMSMHSAQPSTSSNVMYQTESLQLRHLQSPTVTCSRGLVLVFDPSRGQRAVFLALALVWSHLSLGP